METIHLMIYRINSFYREQVLSSGYQNNLQWMILSLIYNIMDSWSSQIITIHRRPSFHLAGQPDILICMFYLHFFFFASCSKFVNILGIDSGKITYVHRYYPYIELIYEFCTHFAFDKEKTLKNGINLTNDR